MRRVFRLLRRLLVVLVVVLLLAAGGIGALLWDTLPDANQTLRLPGLSAPVKVRLDRHGIPFIHAASMLDAATALGYLHARDRMFQMELMRRAASGRLAAIFGPSALPMDEEMRTLGLRRRAVRDLPRLRPRTWAMLAAYARGVNAWIDQRGRFAAPAFLLLGKPEPWTPVDSLLWGKTMSLWLSANWHEELARLALSAKLPRAKIDSLWPPSQDAGRPDAARTSPVRYAAVAVSAAQRVLDVLPRFPAPFTLPGTASNEWAVDSSHTATGAPLLAGDPHLGFGFPSLWYLVRIDTPHQTLAGATAPGVPFLILGHNRRIAWTFTDAEADTQDVFIETPAPGGRYETPSGPKPIKVRQARIRVRGHPDVLLTIRSTRHGPVIGRTADGKGLLAVAMAALTPHDTSADGLLALNRAQSVADAGAAAARVSSPVLNLLAADHTNIALFMTGRVPIRRGGDGAWPVDGADGAHDWIGFASGDQLPHIVAPASGRLVNANERVAPPDFPVFLGRDWFGNWRAQRIRALLAQTDKHRAADFAKMQRDVISAYAQQLLPILTALPVPPGPAAQVVALLRGWNGAMRMNAPQPLIFNAWLRRFRLMVLAKNGVPVRDAGPAHDEFVASLLTGANPGWCASDCHALLVASLQKAVARLSARFGADPSRWRWGAAHQAVFADPVASRIPLLRGFATLRIDSPGDGTTIDRAGLAAHGYDSVHGPEYRGVYDLSDLDRSLFMMTPGESGNLLSAHARDFLVPWRNGKTILLGPRPAHVTGRIMLNP